MATITGGDGPDPLTGTPENDLISGLEGDDFLDGKGGRNTLDGGLGNDGYRFDSRDEGRNTIRDAGGTDALVLIDTPRRDSGDFVNRGDTLTYQFF